MARVRPEGRTGYPWNDPGGDSPGGYPTRGDDKTNLNPIGVWARRARRGNRKAARNLQKWLRSQGYGVKVDGDWGPQTASAYRWYRKGNTASRWASPKVKARNNPRNRFNATPIAGPNPRARRGGGKGGKGGGKPGRGGGGPTFKQQLGGTVKGLGGKKAYRTGQKLNEAQWAEAMAGLQYDAPIKDLKTLIARAGPQNAQTMADIDAWYGNATQLSQQAGQRSGAIAQDVASDQDAAVANLMQALGGGGNDANQAIAASNLQNTGLMRALGGIEQQYHQDMNPIMAAAQASAKTREQRLNLEMLQDYQLQLADMMGQRGQAERAALTEARQQNNQLSQTWFQNRLAQLNAALGAQAADIDMATAVEGIKSSRAQRRQARGQASGKFVPWARLSPPDRTQLLQAAVYLPNGQRRPIGAAQNFLVSMGYAAGSKGANTKTSNRAIVAALRSFYAN
jgi:hypothetical protein